MAPAPSRPDPTVLLVSGSAAVAGPVRELAAAAGVRLLHVERVADAGTSWHRSALVLLGEDAAAAPLPSPRQDLVVVSDGDDSRAWTTAAAVGAARVLVLPHARGQLLELLGSTASGAQGGRGAGPVIGVVGGRGGAGTSTLALGTGLAAVWLGLRAVVVDGDPLGGGIDVLAGAEARPGLRWPDLAGARGAVRPEVLCDGLPEVDGLRLLSWDRERTPTSGRLEPDGARVVLAGASAGHDLVVVDLPRGSGGQDVAVWRLLDAVVLLVPAEVRATLAAKRLADQLRDAVAAVHLVVRTSRSSRVGASVVADALELPVTATWPFDERLAAAAEQSDVVAALWRRHHRGPCEDIVGELLGGGLRSSVPAPVAVGRGAGGRRRENRPVSAR